MYEECTAAKLFWPYELRKLLVSNLPLVLCIDVREDLRVLARLEESTGVLHDEAKIYQNLLSVISSENGSQQRLQKYIDQLQSQDQTLMYCQEGQRYIECLRLMAILLMQKIQRHRAYIDGCLPYGLDHMRLGTLVLRRKEHMRQLILEEVNAR